MAHHLAHRHVPRDSGVWQHIEDVWKEVVGEDGDVQGQQRKRQDDDFRAQSTERRTIFSPTFSGTAGGRHRTRDPSDDTSKQHSTTAAAARPIQASPSTSSSSTPSSTASPKSTPSSSRSQSTSASAATTVPSAISKPSESDIDDSNLAVATNSPTQRGPADSTVSAGQNTPATASATAEASSDSDGGGMSAGAKAGVALGVLGGVAIIGLIVFLLFSRRKKQMEAKQQANNEHEKWEPPLGAAATVAAASSPANNEHRAPRLSLRPVTQFLPTFGADKRNSKGANMMLGPTAAASGPVARSLTPNHDRNAWERPATSESTNPGNPFGNQAERAPTPIMEDSRSVAASDKPLPHGPNSPDSGSSPFDDPASAQSTAMAAAVGAAAGTSLTRKTSTRKGGPKALDLTIAAPMAAVPPSPAGTEFSENSVSTEQAAPPPSAGAAAIAAAGGPVNSTVHRVQLDFKPTMEDEMELGAGQLVRLLHEFDDGWALCIRLDRSQQGVVPRTCLSARPVKPRPNGPPGPGRPGPPRGPGPNGRPMTPQGGPPGGPRGPPYPRPESPMRRPMPPPGRPASPAGGPRGMSPGPGPRSQSPGPRFQGPPGPRPQSPGMGPRPHSPGPRFQGQPRPRPQSPNGMGSRNQSPAGMGRHPMPSPMNPGAPSSQGHHRPGGSTSSFTRKPAPGEAY